MGTRTYRIGEVAEMLQLKTHVLRFWETEFPQLAPLRTESGQRLYAEEHVALLRRIRQLLHEQGMTIEGARRILDGHSAVADDVPKTMDRVPVAGLKQELLEIRRLLAD